MSLKGRVEEVAFTEGEVRRVAWPLVDLLRAPGGSRERQLALGAGFVEVDRQGGHVFGFAMADGYCGWVPEVALAVWEEPTHWVASVGSHLYTGPRAASREVGALPMGARVRVVGRVDKWAETTAGFVPSSHLRPLGKWVGDPVAVAEAFLGTPYLWGGNSRGGIDCSGLVQLVFGVCGVGLPGDADLQQEAGVEVTGELQRGDLIFWDGHVAIVVDAARLIHANGFTMSVAYEGISACIARIADPVVARRRVASVHQAL